MDAAGGCVEFNCGQLRSVAIKWLLWWNNTRIDVENLRIREQEPRGGRAGLLQVSGDKAGPGPSRLHRAAWAFSWDLPAVQCLLA
jgi:hypothetical protein